MGVTIHNKRSSESHTQKLSSSHSDGIDHRRKLIAQTECFAEEIQLLEAELSLPKNNNLLPLRPFPDPSNSLLRVDGWISHSDLSHSRKHPIIIHGAHPIIIKTEYIRPMHAGATLLMSFLSQQFHIISLRKTVRSITRPCITCRRYSVRPAWPATSRAGYSWICLHKGWRGLCRYLPNQIWTRKEADYFESLYLSLRLSRSESGSSWIGVGSDNQSIHRSIA